jgi:hypothetical protein
MAKSNRRPENEEKSTGAYPALALLANGSSGRWSVTLDESTEGSEGWFLQIEGPSLLLSCEVADPDVLDNLATVLEGPTAKPDAFVIGRVDRIPLRLQFDGEHEPTILFTVGPPSRPLIRYSIHGADIQALADATRQAALDLK